MYSYKLLIVQLEEIKTIEINDNQGVPVEHMQGFDLRGIYGNSSFSLAPVFPFFLLNLLASMLP